MCEDYTCECACDCDYDCDCSETKEESDLVCFHQSTFEEIPMSCFGRVCSVSSYITNTKIIRFCKTPVIKICFAVDVIYATDDCEEKKHTIYDSVVFMCNPEGFDLCKMRARVHSVVCESCCSCVKIKSTIQVCGWLQSKKLKRWTNLFTSIFCYL